MTVPALVVMVALAAGNPVQQQVAALEDHLLRHPAATAADAYKLLHQGVFGPGHMVHDTAAAAAYLAQELADLEPVEHSDPLCESLGGDPAVVRIHLRPFRAAGGDPAELIAAFVASAGRVRGSAGRMEAVLGAAVEALRQGGRAAMAAELDRLRAELGPQGFPALHHSDEYREAYKPAYRVALRELADRHGWCEASGSP